MYEEFSEPYGLWECKLAIVRCSGHFDEGLIERIWRNIIKTTLKISTGTPDDKFLVLLNKIKCLWNEYKDVEKCFPIGITILNNF